MEALIVTAASNFIENGVRYYFIHAVLGDFDQRKVNSKIKQTFFRFLYRIHIGMREIKSIAGYLATFLMAIGWTLGLAHYISRNTRLLQLLDADIQ
jgi:hypothetical protein